MVSISVSGIMYDEVKPSAIITYQQNDYFVQKGDRLDDFKVEEIARNHVAISQGANVYRASIGEAFQLEALAGSARYVPANQGGGRHYYSPKYDITLEKKIKGRRYVSEDEIQIKAKEY